MELKERIESEARSVMRISNDQLVCKDCKFRWDDSEIFGNTSQCGKFPNYSKPVGVVFHGENCPEYQKEGDS